MKESNQHGNDFNEAFPRQNGKVYFAYEFLNGHF